MENNQKLSNGVNLNDLWQGVLGEIEIQLSRPDFLTWLKNSRLIEKKEGDGTVLVGLPNNFAKEWVKNRYHKLILGSLRNMDSSIRVVEYIVECQPQKNLVKTKKSVNLETAAETENQKPLIELKIDPETNLNPRYTLKSFIVGSSNELAYAAMTAVMKDIGKKYNPLFIYGGVGLGKTHLLQASGNEIKNIYKNKVKVFYVSSEKFVNDVIWAIRNKKMDDIKKKYRDIDVLIIDDIQFIGGKERTEEEFFHTFNVLYENNKQIIMSSDRPPAAIPTIEERLRSRFEGGMIADISYPDYETRLAILRAKSQENRWQTDEKTLELIASKVKKNIRELEGVLNKVIFYQDVKKDRINTQKLEEIINEVSRVTTKNISANDVIKTVADFFEISSNDLAAKCKKKEVVEPRQIAMYLLREMLNSSYPFIGEKLGKRDHTTVIHACEKISKEINQNPVLNQKIILIKEMINKSG
jgi:chromosomal replication initiator protein